MSEEKLMKFDGNEYAFTKDEVSDYGTDSVNSPMGRAWSRACRSGFLFGKPTGESYQRLGLFYQHFEYAVGVLDDSTSNKYVCFYDARGLVLQESGL